MRFALAAFRLPPHDGCVQELTAGTLLGHYRIVRRLGRGGMGVVYEAEDQKLGRSVAVKLLPEATRQDPAALERFWREARTASSLNHAGICTIYELNESGDQPFIVMELLQGQSLDKIYYRRPMPYAKLLDFRGAGGRCAECGAPKGHSAPRHQAGQYLPVAVRASENSGFRPGKARRGIHQPR
jgi:hypothetical protein